MTSILTNTAAMSALSTLRSISSDMEKTQSNVSSGLRVSSASDNAAYWSIATTMRSDNAALSTVSDALGLGAAKVDTAYAGMDSAISVVTSIKEKLVAATEDGVDKSKVQEEIKQLQQQLTSISEAASFSGENWLQADLADPDATNKSVVASFVRDGTSVSVKKVNYTLDSSNVLFDTGGNLGILDTAFSLAGDGYAATLNVDGVQKTQSLKTYTTADVIGASATFDAGGKVAVIDPAAADGSGTGYIKVGDDSWVKAVQQDGGTVTGQEVTAATYDTTTPFALNSVWTYDLAATGPAVNTTMSVSDLSIDDSTTADALAKMITEVDGALTKMTSAGAQLGSISSRIDMQTEFVSSLTDSLDSGIGKLVDADMNEESTRLKALQTQQSLAIQALSIANSASEGVLTLFR
jgi:flagellin